jgi:hypothetical protein
MPESQPRGRSQGRSARCGPSRLAARLRVGKTGPPSCGGEDSGRVCLERPWRFSAGSIDAALLGTQVVHGSRSPATPERSPCSLANASLRMNVPEHGTRGAASELQRRTFLRRNPRYLCPPMACRKRVTGACDALWRARLEGWPQAKFRRWPSFETARA